MMQKSKLGLGNPIDMIYHMQPWMAVSLIPFVVAIEGVTLASTYQAFRFEHWSQVTHSVFGVLLGATIAFLMEISEFLLLMVTSSLTLSIAGIFKVIDSMRMNLIKNHSPWNIKKSNLFLLQNFSGDFYVLPCLEDKWRSNECLQRRGVGRVLCRHTSPCDKQSNFA
jgi:hypothetical protein